MESVIAEFEQGSEWDSRMLFSGVLFVIGAFVSTFNTEIWEGNDSLLVPLLAIGVSLVALNIILRIKRPKLKVTLFQIQDDLLKICPVKNLQFSGWVTGKSVMVEVSNISNVKAYDFYNSGNHAGMYWVCVELKNKQVIEFNFDNPGLLKDIMKFVKNTLPSVELEVDPGIKT